MPPWVTLTVTMLVAILTIVANAVINTKLKFAPDAESAMRELKQLGNVALRRTLDVALAVSLVYNVVSGEPMTGWRVLVIALGVGAGVFALMSRVMLRLTRIVFEVAHLQGDHAKQLSDQVGKITALQAEQTDAIGRIVGIIDQIKPDRAP